MNALNKLALDIAARMQRTRTVQLTAASTTVDPAFATKLIVDSDNATAANRLLVLSKGKYDRQEIIIEYVPNSTGQFKINVSTGGMKLSADWAPTVKFSTITFFYDANNSLWIEKCRTTIA